MNRITPCLVSAALSLSCALSPKTVAAATPGPSAPARAQERIDKRTLVRRILPQNVRVLVFEGDEAQRSASGVVIGAESVTEGVASYVITNAHVVDTRGMKAPRIKVLVDSAADSVEYSARAVAVGSVPDMDLALVKVEGVRLTPAQLAADRELELGDDVLVVAAPFGRSLSLSGGMLSQVEFDRKRRIPRMVKTDAAIGYGASGGGIFSLATGKLLAIVEGYRTAKVGFAVKEQDFSFDVPMPGETFAAPSAKVRTFLEQNGFGRLLAGTDAGEGAQTALR